MMRDYLSWLSQHMSGAEYRDLVTYVEIEAEWTEGRYRVSRAIFYSDVSGIYTPLVIRTWHWDYIDKLPAKKSRYSFIYSDYQRNIPDEEICNTLTRGA